MNQKWTALLLTTAMLATGASAALAYETLQPGSNGQEVLDARMRLYELGYFKKQPTQTEYTENMKKYVRQFEKDYGLTQKTESSRLLIRKSSSAAHKAQAKPSLKHRRLNPLSFPISSKSTVSLSTMPIRIKRIRP